MEGGARGDTPRERLQWGPPRGKGVGASSSLGSRYAWLDLGTHLAYCTFYANSPDLHPYHNLLHPYQFLSLSPIRKTTTTTSLERPTSSTKNCHKYQIVAPLFVTSPRCMLGASPIESTRYGFGMKPAIRPGIPRPKRARAAQAVLACRLHRGKVKRARENAQA
jgi:hypothetical protein